MKTIKVTQRVEITREYELTLEDIGKIEKDFKGDLKSYLDKKFPLNEDEAEEIIYSKSKYQKMKELLYDKNIILHIVFDEIKCNSPILNEKQKDLIFKLKDFTMNSFDMHFLDSVVVKNNIAYATDSIIFVLVKNFGIEHISLFNRDILNKFNKDKIDLIAYPNSFGVKIDNKCYKYHQDMNYIEINPVKRLLNIEIDENKFKDFFINLDTKNDYLKIDETDFKIEYIKKILKYFNPDKYQIVEIKQSMFNIKVLLLKDNDVLIFLSETKKQ